jgi:hypothetical protein
LPIHISNLYEKNLKNTALLGDKSGTTQGQDDLAPQGFYPGADGRVRM